MSFKYEPSSEPLHISVNHALPHAARVPEVPHCGVSTCGASVPRGEAKFHTEQGQGAAFERHACPSSAPPPLSRRGGGVLLGRPQRVLVTDALDL